MGRGTGAGLQNHEDEPRCGASIEEIDRMCTAAPSLDSIGHETGYFRSAANVRANARLSPLRAQPRAEQTTRLRDAARSIANRVHLFIVGPDDPQETVEGAFSIVQHASTFLISTLPNAMLTDEPVSALRAASARNGDERSILGSVRDLLDTNVDAGRRCRAVEEIEYVDATLPPALIRQLLSDVDPTVARYALGLIPGAADCEHLVETARAHHRNDAAFVDELDILCKLLSQGQQ